MKLPLFIAFGFLVGSALNAQPTATVAELHPSPAKASSAAGASSAPKLGEGAHFDELRVGERIYRDVKVREVTARSILVLNTDGIASIPLRELPADLQRAFGYQPALEAAANDRLAAAAHQSAITEHARPHAAKEKAQPNFAEKFEQLAEIFKKNTPPEIVAEVDLRPRFREYGLRIKDQGRRPSCVIFAVVSAVEFENAEIAEQTEPLSEDYLIWATCQTLKRAPYLIGPKQLAENVDDEDHDLGFSFRSVLESMRVFGIAAQSEMPDSFGRFGKIPPPSAELIHDVALRRKLIIHYLPGATNSIRIANIIHVLNHGIPVPVAVFWPSNRLVRTGFLNTQPPGTGDGHAITLVGYKCSTGNLEDTQFIFRNSYGPRWGEGGYGHVTFKYLSTNLQVAVALEVQRS